MSRSDHGSVGSYVTGFVLSIIFTVIPYYLVTQKVFSGNQLLVVILGFAAVQTLIQIFFFLHLGRGPKPFYNIVFFASTVVIIGVVVGGSLFIMSHLHYNMSPTETTKQLAEKEGIYQVEGNKTGACQATKTNHQIIVSNGMVQPLKIEANLCDTLSFTNKDSSTHMIMFGTPDDLQTYAGEDEVVIRKGKSETMTLNQVGAYSFHLMAHGSDHGEVVGSFTVN